MALYWLYNSNCSAVIGCSELKHQSKVDSRVVYAILKDGRGQRKHVEYAAFGALTKSLEEQGSANFLSDD